MNTKVERKMHIEREEKEDWRVFFIMPVYSIKGKKIEAIARSTEELVCITFREMSTVKS